MTKGFLLRVGVGRVLMAVMLPLPPFVRSIVLIGRVGLAVMAHAAELSTGLLNKAEGRSCSPAPLPAPASSAALGLHPCIALSSGWPVAIIRLASQNATVSHALDGIAPPAYAWRQFQ